MILLDSLPLLWSGVFCRSRSKKKQKQSAKKVGPTAAGDQASVRLVALKLSSVSAGAWTLVTHAGERTRAHPISKLPKVSATASKLEDDRVAPQDQPWKAYFVAQLARVGDSSPCNQKEVIRGGHEEDDCLISCPQVDAEQQSFVRNTRLIHWP